MNVEEKMRIAIKEGALTDFCKTLINLG